ncbi:MAG: hypothetical protein ACI82E_001146, partial [Nonlabens sp.]
STTAAVCCFTVKKVPNNRKNPITSNTGIRNIPNPPMVFD